MGFINTAIRATKVVIKSQFYAYMYEEYYIVYILYVRDVVSIGRMNQEIFYRRILLEYRAKL